MLTRMVTLNEPLFRKFHVLWSISLLCRIRLNLLLDMTFTTEGSLVLIDYKVRLVPSHATLQTRRAHAFNDDTSEASCNKNELPKDTITPTL
jgi:hypothetical protein